MWVVPVLENGMAFRTARHISLIRESYSDLALSVYSLAGVVIDIDCKLPIEVLLAPLGWQRWLNLYPVEPASIGLQGVTASYQATPHGRCSPPVHADLLGTTPARLFLLSLPSGLLYSKYPKPRIAHTVGASASPLLAASQPQPLFT